MTNEEQELAAIACGKRSKEDQELWSDLAQDIFLDLAKTCSEAVNIRGMVVCDDLGATMASDAFALADAFMAERAKRLKGGA